MKERLLRRARIELSHYHELGESVKAMLLSWTYLIIAWPMVVTFINAYLWQQGDGVNRLVVYNTWFFVGLPIGFYLNKYILNKLHVLKVYYLGAVLQGLSALLVVYLPTGTLMNLGLLGLLFGVGSGFYWANKSYLTLRLTRGKNRMYYNSMETVIDEVVNIVLPVILGWLLVAGELNGWYSKELAYRVMLGVGMILLFMCGQVVQKAPVKDFVVKRLFPRKVSREWWDVRMYNILTNLWSGLGFFLPSVLILTYLGEEGVLGTMQSLAALFSAMVVYIVGRKINNKNAWQVVLLGNSLLLLGALILAFNQFWGVVMFMVVTAVGKPLSSTAGYSVVMDVMDKQEGADNTENQYAYIFDTELFFNIGRLMGVGLFVLMVSWLGITATLKGVAVLAGVARLGASYYQKKLVAVVS